MKHDFPQRNESYLKAATFQDEKVPVVFKGYDQKANCDREVKGRVISWKESLKYCLRYSFPEWAVDEAGEKRLDKNGKPFKNRNYDPNYPHGYSIVYHFDIGDLESGSLPLWEEFCTKRPKPDEHLLIWKTGKEKETKWFVKRVGETEKFGEELPVFDVNGPRNKPQEAEGEEETPF